MSRDPTLRILGGLALALLVLGLLMNIASLFGLSELRGQSSRYVGLLDDLSELERGVAQSDAVIQAWEARASDAEAAETLQAMADDKLRGRNAVLQRVSREALLERWELERVRLQVPDVPVDAALDFVRRAEAAQVPWRMVACDIQSGADHAGRADVRLELIQIRPRKN